MSVLDKVNSPADVKALAFEELPELAAEVRAAVLHKVSNYGGHVGPNLGVVEMTVALHRVFDSPKDKLIWDVSHQSYPHKILTGRKTGFTDGHFHDVTPYTSQEESEHDFFKVGHTSTSIANALGLAKARDLCKDSGNIIAIIGDGSLSGGLAYEALNNAGAYQGNLIIIVNDNQMSIAENHGGMYKNLAALRETHGFAPDNLFRAFGLDYYYLDEGNDIPKLIEVFEKFKDINHPIVLHISTEKGHGYAPAVANKEAYHWRSPFELETGEAKHSGSAVRNYNEVLLDIMDQKISEGVPIFAINAAVPGAFNLKKFAAGHPDRYYDAGIAEQFTLTFGGAMAMGGARPIIFHNSTFLQRGYDQMVHDLAVNNEPAIVVLHGAVISDSDTTHQGSLAIGWISNIPNLVYLAPTSEEELTAMMNWGLAQSEHSVVIQLPEHGLEHRSSSLKDFSQAKFDIRQKGERVALLGLGGMYHQVETLAKVLEKAQIHATLVNPLFISQLDKAALSELGNTHSVIATFEDGIVDGGFGQKVASYLGAYDVRVLNFGAWKEFNEEVPLEELYARYHLTPMSAANDIISALVRPAQ
ncbi:MAG: 1-deoxy-D-xylulose-5-phosphate synthase [Streptococcaceae bacterium]|nr:1-deoxy-D-xylulose-5-phosphate synthase [Streptococcaceae bacterium]